MNSQMTIIFLFFTFVIFEACDWQRLDKCEWYLVPEPKYAHTVKKGYVAICLRNYTTGKEKCFLDMKLEEAEKVYGNKIRYSSVELDSSSMPRRILKYSICRE